MPSQPNGNHGPSSQQNGHPKESKKGESDSGYAVKEISLTDGGGLSSGADRFGIIIHSILPILVNWGAIISLIFGGCCSNVFALEAIVKEEPDSGLLITFVQFIVTFIFALPNHVSASNPPLFLKAPAIPLVRWIPNILIFFSVNMLNNFAFSYNISVPVHIILRSGGSVTTMLVGWIWGKRYTRMQVFSVAMLTAGVIVAAMSDAESKGEDWSASTSTPTASFVTGLTILFVAQLLSAIMGLYTQATYAIYGPHWNENLFYSHFLSLPLFIPFSPLLLAQFIRLWDSPLLEIPLFASPPETQPISWMSTLLTFSRSAKPFSQLTLRVPTHIFNLLLNCLAQYVCIRGVNLLGARTSALGVTIVLNMRKLVSLFISIWLFGNQLPLGVLAGATVVFVGGAVYVWEGTRMQQRKLKTP